MATPGKRTKNGSVDPAPAKSYTHKDQTALMRPDVGTQAQFKKRKESVRYAYDHPIPLLQWDGDNPAREQGESLIREILEAGSPVGAVCQSPMNCSFKPNRSQGASARSCRTPK
jgi:hypothetical protein